MTETEQAEHDRRYKMPEPRIYRIVRNYFSAGIRKRTIREKLTLSEAQAHCSDPETSSSTCKGKVGKARTRRVGPWFDSYTDR